MLALVLIIICNILCLCTSIYYNKTTVNQDPPILAAEVSSTYKAGYSNYNQNNDYYPPKQTKSLWYSQFPGPNYPSVEMCSFIDDNKALMRRMYGTLPPHDLYNNEIFTGPPRRNIRQTSPEGKNFCSSTKEIITPFWYNNSSGYRLALVNFPPFQQAVHIETCRESRACGTQTNCFCSQDYTWHRLLAYDAAESCRGIFMEWFRFPSCCICKCFN